jgi:hypothetical protein
MQRGYLETTCVAELHKRPELEVSSAVCSLLFEYLQVRSQQCLSRCAAKSTIISSA